MNKILKIKLGLPILAILIAVIASAFTTKPVNNRFTGTSYYAQETGAITYAVGFTFVTLLTGITNVTVIVSSDGGVIQYALAHCTTGFTRTCVVATISASSGPNVGKPKITVIRVGEWHS
jgi:hypothetical protein